MAKKKNNSVVMGDGSKGKVIYKTMLYVIENEDGDAYAYAELDGWWFPEVKDIYKEVIEGLD